MRQYGEDPNQPLNQRDAVIDRSPNAKAPTADEVQKIHTNSDLNARPESQHHTLGDGPNEAAAGDHDHITKGVPILSSVILTGAKSGENAAVISSIINALKAMGAKDNTT